MIDLAQTYEKAGPAACADGELPDYLPVVLEYASTQPPARGARLPGRDRAHPATSSSARCASAAAAYASVLAALLDLAGEKAQAVNAARR